MPIPDILPPDPDTRTPRFRLPANACDAHTHIFGPDSKYPYAAKRPYTPHDAGLDAFRSLHGRLGTQRCVIVNATPHGYDNTVVTDAIAEREGRYLGIANVHDRMSDKELEALGRAGIRGCRFTFLSRLGGAPDMAAFHRIVDRIKPLGWHVDLYLEADGLAAFVPILEKLPIAYVIDHMGRPDAGKGLDQPGFADLLALAQRDEKCWVKLTCPERATRIGAPFGDVVPFARALVEAVPDRVLWGTDWPHPNVKAMPNDGDLVDFVPSFAPEPDLQRKLLVDNPQRLFKFGS